MTAKPTFLTIGEVAGRVGVRTSALRYYERVGLLPPPARASGQRRYAAEMVDRLRLIGFAKQAGFRLAEIRTLLGARGPRGKTASVAAGWRRIVPGKIAELEKEMTRLEQARLRLQSLMACQCREPEQCGRQLQEHPVDGPQRRRSTTQRNPVR